MVLENVLGRRNRWPQLKALCYPYQVGPFSGFTFVFIYLFTYLLFLNMHYCTKQFQEDDPNKLICTGEAMEIAG